MENVEAKLKTYNLSEAVELMNQGFLVREINWESRFISNFDKDGIEKRYKVFDYLKIVKTNIKGHQINQQPYIAKFYYNGGWMPNPYIPTSYEMMAGEFVVIDIKNVKEEIELYVDEEKIVEKEDKISEDVRPVDFYKTKTDFYHTFITSLIFKRKEVATIGKASYVVVYNDFEININVVLDENVVKVRDGKNKEDNMIHIEISKSYFENTSSDFLIYLFMWFWFKRFYMNGNPFLSSHRKNLGSDELALSYVTDKYKNLKLSSIVDGLFNLFSQNGTKDINSDSEQKERLENLANKCSNIDPVFHFKKESSEVKGEKEVLKEIPRSPLEIILTQFYNLSKDDFKRWLDSERDDLLFLEQELIGNAIKEYIKSNQKK